ncbi:MAG: cyclopropane fatty acyl phospholipid synthase [Patescibacteria group bacterium]|nr:cyclopropane fatty acyl phospholipid synthase [bacterium]MDZ4240746.1 cyclopropane fatty acyl phospholipid synthase [Patescibacteria group bacterium]
MTSKEFVEALAREAEFTINGSQPWDMRVKDEGFFDRLVRFGSLGLGESYMDGWWESDDLEETIGRILKANLPLKIIRSPRLLLSIASQYIAGLFGVIGMKKRAFESAKKHYDLGNEMFEKMLDKRMIYSCGYWRNAKSLDKAQEDKLDLICKKLKLKKGMKLLEIGCGWGGLLEYAARNYGIKGVGITVSKEQAAMARERVKDLPIEIRIEDYRDTVGEFDRIVSVGMFENVGYKYFPIFFKKVLSLLKDKGVFLIHTIGTNAPGVRGDPWFEKYIFPNCMLPELTQIEKASRAYFILEDLQNFGPDYATTLREWFKRFNNAWPTLKEKYGERFYRMWKYYLLSSAATFHVRDNQLWQFVFRKHQTEGTYESVR